MRGMKSMGGVRELTLGGWVSLASGMFQRRLSEKDFSFPVILAEAAKEAGLASSSEADVPDRVWWQKLCDACASKSCSAVGEKLLRTKLVHALSQRLAVEEAYRINSHEIEKENIVEPFFVIGLPRTSGHFITHVFARSGLFLSPRMQDTWSPAQMVESERERAFHRVATKFERMHPDFRCVRQLIGDVVDDDLSLHLHVPQSYAWGLLHGLDEYLLKCIQEDQEAVFAYTKKVLKLFQWYRRCGHFSDCVQVEFNTLENPIELQRSGPKLTLSKMPWLLHSPLGILSAEALHKTFPDMNVIWTHRALASALPSLCSSLAIHNSLYTGRTPSETTLAQIGEKVLGMFGSGTDSAIDYFATFDKQKMVHWSNRDANRHCARLMLKTMQHFNLEIDRHRRIHGINAQTEYMSTRRPLHDSNLQYFGLHEGVVGHLFEGYIRQFEEFAFEKKYGLTVQDYQPLATTNDQQLLTRRNASTGDKGLGEGQPLAGHFLGEGNLWK